MSQECQPNTHVNEDLDEITQYLALSNTSRTHSRSSKRDSESHIGESYEEDHAPVEGTITPSSLKSFENTSDSDDDSITQYRDLPSPKLLRTSTLDPKICGVNFSKSHALPLGHTDLNFLSSLSPKKSDLYRKLQPNVSRSSSMYSTYSDTRLSLLKETKRRLSNFSHKVSDEIEREESFYGDNAARQLSNKHQCHLEELQAYYEKLYNDRALQLHQINEKKLLDLEETYRLKLNELESETMRRFLIEQQKCEDSLNQASSRFQSLESQKLPEFLSKSENEFPHGDFLLELQKEKMWLESRMKRLKYLYQDYRSRLLLVRRAIDHVAPLLDERKFQCHHDDYLSDPLASALKESLFIQQKDPLTHRSDDGYSSHSQIDCDLEEGIILPSASSTVRPRRTYKSFPQKSTKEDSHSTGIKRQSTGTIFPEQMKVQGKRVTLREPQETTDLFLERVMNQCLHSNTQCSKG